MKTQILTVDKIYAAKEGNNPDFVTLQVRTEVAREDSGSILSAFLGGNYKEKRVAFQSMHKDQVAKFGIAEGCNLNEKMGLDLRITVTESLEKKEGYQAKINPQTKEALTKGGQIIYRKAEITGLDKTDTLIKHDVIAVEAVAEVSTKGAFQKA